MKYSKIFLILATAALLIGCNSQKKLAKGEQTVPETPKTEVIKKKTVQQRAVEAQPEFQSVLAQRARFSVVYQQKNISGNGTITFIKDSICIISVQPILGIELARLEATPHDILFVDKMNKRYVQLTYEEAQKETGLPITFADLQHLLMGHMTVIGQPQEVLWSDKAKAQSKSGKTELSLTEGKLSYLYLIDEANLALIGSDIRMTGGKGKANVTYSGHTLFSDILFPQSVKVVYTNGSTDASCTITLPNLVFNGQVNAQRLNLRSYKKTTLSTILK